MRVDWRTAVSTVVLIAGAASLLGVRLHVPQPDGVPAAASQTGTQAGVKLKAILADPPQTGSSAISIRMADDLIAARERIALLQTEVASLKDTAAAEGRARARGSADVLAAATDETPPPPPPPPPGGRSPDPPSREVPSYNPNTDKPNPPRCTRDGCAFEFPGPLAVVPQRADELPTFPNSCLLPYPVGRGPVLPGRSTGNARSHKQCLQRCIAAIDCIAWVHHAKPGNGGGGNGGGGGECVLHTGFLAAQRYSKTITSAQSYQCCSIRNDVLQINLRNLKRFHHDTPERKGCSPPEADTKYSPIDDVAGGGGRTIETSDQACSVRCIATPGCAHWSRWSADGTGGCHISPDNATRVPYKGATSGSCVVGQSLWQQQASGSNNCVSGLVRAGLPRRDDPANPLVIAPSEPNPAVDANPDAGAQPASASGGPGSLADLNLAVLGQCHNHNCLDVHHCAARYRGRGRFAFVHTDDLKRPPWKPDGAFKRPLPDTPERMRLIEVAKAHGADMVFVVPDPSNAAYALSQLERDFFAEHGIKVVEVPWSVPPNMPPLKPGHTRSCDYGINMDFVKIHVLGLDQYDAVIMYDSDVEVFGDVTAVFRCAAQNYVLSTSGPQAPLNMGFLAFKPNNGFKAAAIALATGVTFDQYTGWVGMGFEPVSTKTVLSGAFAQAGCGQGFFWALAYKNGERNSTAGLDAAWRTAGVPRPQAFQIDRCIWNYQNEDGPKSCGPGFQCDMVRAIHKRNWVPRGKTDPLNGTGCFYEARDRELG